MNRSILIGIAFFLPTTVIAGEPKAPATVKELFADFDPRRDPLDAKVVREWEKDGITIRYVTFHIGTFKGKRGSYGGVLRFPQRCEKDTCSVAPSRRWAACLLARSRVLRKAWLPLPVDQLGRSGDGERQRRRPEHRLGSR